MAIVGERSFDMREIMWLVEPELSGVTTSKLDDCAFIPHRLFLPPFHPSPSAAAASASVKKNSVASRSVFGVDLWQVPVV